MKKIIERLHKKAEKKHGDNTYGKWLFWSAAALRAYPSSPLQRAIIAEAEKFRSR